MDDQLFGELLESVREMGRILRGEVAPSRVFSVPAGDHHSLHLTGVGPFLVNITNFERQFAAILELISPESMNLPHTDMVYESSLLVTDWRGDSNDPDYIHVYVWVWYRSEGEITSSVARYSCWIHKEDNV